MSSTPTSEQHRATVLRHFDAKLALDASTLAADLTSDVAWWAPRSAARLGMSRPLVGRDAVVAMLITVPLYEPDSRSWTMHHVIADDNTAVVHARLTARTRSGNHYENEYVFVFRFRGAQVEAIWEHLDTAYAYERFDAEPERA